jgi:hypothetical protein
MENLNEKFKDAKKIKPTTIIDTSKEIETKETSEVSKLFEHTENDNFEGVNFLEPKKEQIFFDEQNNNSNEQTQINNSSVNLGEVVPTAVAVELFDSIASKILAIVATKITKKKVYSAQFCASKKEKDTILPVAEAYLSSVNMQMTPLSALVVTISTIYGMKAVEIAANSGGVNESTFDDTTIDRRGRKPKDGQPSAYMRKKYGEAGL